MAYKKSVNSYDLAYFWDERRALDATASYVGPTSAILPWADSYLEVRGWLQINMWLYPPFSRSRALQAGFTQARKHGLRGLQSTSGTDHSEKIPGPPRIPEKTIFGASECSFSVFQTDFSLGLLPWAALLTRAQRAGTQRGWLGRSSCCGRSNQTSSASSPNCVSDNHEAPQASAVALLHQANTLSTLGS